jgi:AcrR family transcriptional regulator
VSSTGTSPTRARGELAKAARRAELLGAARRRFDEVGFEATTMAEVAAAAGVSKGATYLYFASKESLFLKLLLLDLRDWAAAVEQRLDGSRSRSARGVARALAGELAARRRLVRLLALVEPVLEARTDAAEIVRFERQFLARLGPLATRLEERLADLEAGDGVRLLLRLRALAAGLAFRAEPAPALREALAGEPALAPLAVELERELADCLTALIDGWR